MEAKCSATMQQKTTICKEKAIALLEKKALPSARNYMVKASVGTKRVWKTLTAVWTQDRAQTC